MKKIIITGTGMKTWKHMAILTENMDVSEMFLELGENLKNHESQNILLDLKKMERRHCQPFPFIPFCWFGNKKGNCEDSPSRKCIQEDK